MLLNDDTAEHHRASYEGLGGLNEGAEGSMRA
jgi:hypothetical protein